MDIEQTGHAPEQSPTPETALTIDQAVERFKAKKAEREAAEKPEAPRHEEAPTEDAPVGEPEAVEPEGAEAPSEPDEDQGADEPEAEEDAGEDEQGDDAGDIDPPSSWKAEDREWFKSLDKRTQEVIANREKQRDGAVNQRLQGLAESQKQAEAALERITAFAERGEQALDLANRSFEDRWAKVTEEDWVIFASEHPDQYPAVKARYEADLAARTKLEQQVAEAQREKIAAQQQQTISYIKTHLPDIASPAKLKEIADYAEARGVSREELQLADGPAWAILRDAYLYRSAQQTAEKKAKAPKPAKKAPPPVKSAAAASGISSLDKQIQAAQARLKRTGRVEDAVALNKLRRQKDGRTG